MYKIRFLINRRQFYWAESIEIFVINDISSIKLRDQRLYKNQNFKVDQHILHQIKPFKNCIEDFNKAN